MILFRYRYHDFQLGNTDLGFWCSTYLIMASYEVGFSGPNPWPSGERRPIPMKSKEYWTLFLMQAQQEFARTSKLITGFDKAEPLLRARYGKRSRLARHRLESRRAQTSKRAIYLQKRIEYFQERITALETRTRYDRILRTPVI